MDDFNNDLFDFTRKLQLRYHFRDSEDIDPSIVKLPSTYTPPPNEDPELERVIHQLKDMRVYPVRPKNRNMTMESHAALQSLTQKVDDGDLVLKSADKGDVTVVMSSDYYYKMCMNELTKEKFYRSLGNNDPSNIVMTDVINFANNYRDVLTEKEYEFLTKKKYRMANFYTLPKLHKSTLVNNMLQSGSEYVHSPDFQDIVEGRPIVGGPAFHTSGISEMINIILNPIIAHIPWILKDSFDFVDRCNHSVPDDTVLGTADIKALYTNISKELVFTAIEYWVNRYHALIPSLQRFGLQFILDGLEIILNHNYFLFDCVFYQQIHGFAMGTKAAVDCANLSVGYLEVKWCDRLSLLYPLDYVRHIIDTYFRFLDDVFYEWLLQFYVKPFQSSCNAMYANLLFIFPPLAKEQDYLEVHAKVVDYELQLHPSSLPRPRSKYRPGCTPSARGAVQC